MKVGPFLKSSLFALGFIACGQKVGRPLPEPPALAPIDSSLLTDSSSSGTSAAGEVALSGGPGAAVVGASIRLINLSNAEIVESDTAGLPVDDGSFGLQIEGQAGEWLRFEQALNGTRSPPTDIKLVGGTLAVVVRPDCIEFSGAPYVEFTDAVWRAELRNACDAALTIESLELSRPSTQLELTSEPTQLAGQSLAPGELLSVSLQLSGATLALDANVVLIVVQLGAETIPYASVVLTEP